MKDDDYGVRLLRPLATEPPAATRISVAEAMRVGRRARRTRMWSIFSGLIAVIAAGAIGSALALTAPAAKPKPHLPTDPTIPAACTAIRLPTGGAALAAVTGGDPSGTYLVGTTNPDSQKTKAVLVWRDGKLVASVPQTGRSSVMSDINASGVAVGSNTESPFLPYVYRNGGVRRLTGTGNAQAINDAGMIAGTRQISYQEIPERWASPDAQPELMKLPPGTLGGKAIDIAEDGTITVTLSTKTYIQQAYLWFPDGTTRAIDAPKAGKGQTTRFWSAYFRFGWLYGDVVTFEPATAASSGPPGDPNAPQGAYRFNTASYRYHVASGTWQKLPKGAAFDLTTPFVTLEAFIGKQIFTFPEPANKRADDDFQIASVSDDGRTAGGRSLSNRADPSHQDEPFMWRCT
jgi:hypothetical protein